MSYIEKELTKGERIVLLGHVSAWTIVPRTLLTLAVFAAVAVVAGMLSWLVPLFWMTAAPLAILLWIALVAQLLFRLFTTEIAITDRRVMSKTGLLQTEVKVTPLDKVNNVNVRQSVFGNMLDYGDIEVTTATADTNDNHSVASLAHADVFRNTLTEITQN